MQVKAIGEEKFGATVSAYAIYVFCVSVNIGKENWLTICQICFPYQNFPAYGSYYLAENVGTEEKTVANSAVYTDIEYFINLREKTLDTIYVATWYITIIMKFCMKMA